MKLTKSKLKEIIREELKEAGGWEAPDIKAYKELEKINMQVYRIVGSLRHKADMDKAIHTWMVGLHVGLKKRGIKIK